MMPKSGQGSSAMAPPATTNTRPPSVSIPSSPSSSNFSQQQLQQAPVARTPSSLAVVDFPGAFTTQPRTFEPHELESSIDRITIVPRAMKNRVTEAVGGSIAGVVGGVYSIVSYVNPLGHSAKPAQSNATDHTDAGETEQESHAEAHEAHEVHEAHAEEHEEHEALCAEDGSGSKPGTPPSILQVPSGGSSIVADIDEHLVADANADNPESNRPPTPTKPSFTRMLRFPAHPVADASMHASNAEYKQAVRNDPVSMNVSQRTGHQFRPGAEEKRRYMRRMSKAPQLNASVPIHEGMPSLHVGEGAQPAVHRAPSHSRTTPPNAGGEGESTDESDESEDEFPLDGQQLGAAAVAECYHAAADSQRSDSKTRAIEPWRFIVPRVKRVKRRALWRLFLAQEIAPSVYDEATEQMHQHQHQHQQQMGKLPRSQTNSTTSSPMLSPQRTRNASLSPASTTAGADSQAQDNSSLRRRMLESAAMRTTSSPEWEQQQQQPGLKSRASQNLQKSRAPSIAPSMESHNSGRTATNASGAHAQKPAAKNNAIWTMEFSTCGKYLAAGGQDGVVRIWRIAAFAREQDREKKQPAAANPDSPAGVETPTSATRQQRGKAANRDVRLLQSESAESPTSQRSMSSHKRTSTVYMDSADLLPYANSAPIAKGKHGRSISVGQPLQGTRVNPFTTPDALSGACTLPTLPLLPDPSAASSAGDHDNASRSSSRTNSMVNTDVAAAQLHPMHAYELLEPVPFRSYVGHTADVLSLSWSKNGFLLSASMDRTVRLWHPHRPECLCTFRHRDIVASVAFNPRDDRLFISGSLDCKLRLWDIPARGVKHWTKLPDGQMVTSVAFTGPKGDHIVAGTYRGMCVFYSTDGLTVQGRMHARSSRGRNSKGSKITGFSYLPTGEMSPQLASRLGLAPKPADPAGYQLLVSSNDSRLRMFHPQARQLERKYKGHANASSQAFARPSSDGRYIISGSEDHNVYVWSVAQDNAATVATHPNSDHIRRVRGSGNGNKSTAPQSISAESGSVKQEKNILGGLFGRRRSDKPTEHAVGGMVTEGDGEWESLDGKVEEKSIYEYFPAHDAAVSQALFAPASTLQYLATHDDPILSRRKMRFTNKNGEVENAIAAASNATFGGPGDGGRLPPAEGGEDERLVEDMTAIIVSADTSGNIRVFRKDINVHRIYTQDGHGSKSSLLKAKESIGSLGRVMSCDKSTAADLVVASPRASHYHPPIEHELAAAEQEVRRQSLDGSDVHAGAGQQKGGKGVSFWSKLGRRKSQSHRHSAMPLSVSGALPHAVDALLPAKLGATPEGMSPRPVIASAATIAGDRAAAVSPAAVTPRVARRAALPMPTQEQDADVCEYCGHRGFIEFSVASPPATAAGALQQGAGSSLAVCENCKRVKNMPPM